MQVIRVGTLIDGSGAAPVRDATLVIDNGRIEAVTTTDPSARPAGAASGADVIDASGLTALPGLIDCHDHLAMHGYELARRWGLDEPRSTSHMRTAAIARQILASGYTAIRDAGGLDAGFGLAIREGLLAAATVIALVTLLGGVALGFFFPVEAAASGAFALFVAGLLEGFARQLVQADLARYAIAGAMLLAWLTYFYWPRRPAP